MFFGMNELLRDLINMGKVAVFINDVIVGTEDKKRHNKLVAEVIKRLEENNLYVKSEKCKWKVREVGFLGVVIRPESIKIEKEKMKGVLDWPTPKCVKDVQNYYCQFIQGFSSIARPLYNLVKKNQKWDWMEKQEEVFRKLKEKFTKKLMLAALDIDKKMRIEVDVLNYATGRVLSMKCEDGSRWRLVAFLSKSLNETEKNYEIHDKEMLAIIRGLENWRHSLEGTHFKFKIWTDHKDAEVELQASLMGVIPVKI